MADDNTSDDPMHRTDLAEASAGGEANLGRQTHHVYWLLLAALAASPSAWTFSDEERSRMAEHLTHCDDCRARLATLDSTLVAALPPATT